MLILSPASQAKIQLAITDLLTFLAKSKANRSVSFQKIIPVYNTELLCYSDHHLIISVKLPYIILDFFGMFYKVFPYILSYLILTVTLERKQNRYALQMRLNDSPRLGYNLLVVETGLILMTTGFPTTALIP